MLIHLQGEEMEQARADAERRGMTLAAHVRALLKQWHRERGK